MILAYVISYVIVFLMFFIGVFTTMVVFVHTQPTMNMMTNNIRYEELPLVKFYPDIIVPAIHRGFDRNIALMCCQLVSNLYFSKSENKALKLHATYSFEGTDPVGTETELIDTFGSIHSVGGVVLVMFRGSKPAVNEWLVNMRYQQISSDDATGIILPSMMNRTKDIWGDESFKINHRDSRIMLHSGWATLAGKLTSSISKQIEKLISSNPNAPVVLGGHSMGGCVTLILAAELATLFPSVEFILYTFACPRVGNYAFVDYVNSLENLTVHRVSNASDIFCEAIPAVAPNYTDPDKPFFYNQCGKLYSFEQNSLSVRMNHTIVTYSKHFE